jgi:pyrroline-5-carboxylate reductase
MDTVLNDIAARGLVLLGCGKMGSAMLSGWIAAGVPADAFTVIEPAPPPALQALGVRLGTDLPPSPAAVVLAVKPQMMADALPSVAGLAGPETMVLSVAAGLDMAWFEARLGADAALVRAMPNTPAAVGRGITAIIANDAGARYLPLAEALLSAVGDTVRLSAESEMDAVTGVSGSGPAYVFHMIEALAAAGEAQGLAPDLAMKLARATVCGAGALAAASDETAETLRVNVTSPGGTTAAGLAELMDPERGLPPLMARTVAAAAARSKALRA